MSVDVAAVQIGLPVAVAILSAAGLMQMEVMAPWMQKIGEFGLMAMLVGFFVWQTSKREEAMRREHETSRDWERTRMTMMFEKITDCIERVNDSNQKLADKIENLDKSIRS